MSNSLFTVSLGRPISSPQRTAKNHTSRSIFKMSRSSVADQDRSLRFYVDKLGFHLRLRRLVLAAGTQRWLAACAAGWRRHGHRSFDSETRVQPEEKFIGTPSEIAFFITDDVPRHVRAMAGTRSSISTRAAQDLQVGRHVRIVRRFLRTEIHSPLWASTSRHGKLRRSVEQSAERQEFERHR